MNSHYDRESPAVEDATAERLMNQALSATGAEKEAFTTELQQYLRTAYGVDFDSDSPELMDAPDTDSEELWHVERNPNRSPVERLAARTERENIIRDAFGYFLVACFVALMMPAAFTAGIAVTVLAIAVLASIAAVRLVSLTTA
jgi:hypothetical protein